MLIFGLGPYCRKSRDRVAALRECFIVGKMAPFFAISDIVTSKQFLSENVGEDRCGNYCDSVRRDKGAGIAAVFAVALAVLQKDVIRPRPHQAESLVSDDARLSHVRAAAEVAPLPIHCKEQWLAADWQRLFTNLTLLSDFAAHRRQDARQVLQRGLLFAVGDRQCAVVERICAFRIRVGATVPALDACACEV